MLRLPRLHRHTWAKWGPVIQNPWKQHLPCPPPDWQHRACTTCGAAQRRNV